jgi:hypothetical protein
MSAAELPGLRHARQLEALITAGLRGDKDSLDHLEASAADASIVEAALSMLRAPTPGNAAVLQFASAMVMRFCRGHGETEQLSSHCQRCLQVNAS